ncbi:MAG: histidinol dehydrogenase [Armatimonadetes bacterium]|nr:histidinol dehydrogenase [Armatimonadota bacterium]
MSRRLLPLVTIEEAIRRTPKPLDEEAVARSEEILRSIEERGWEAAVSWANELGDLVPGQAAVLQREELQAALNEIPQDHRELLSRVRDRIARFAEVQLASLRSAVSDIPGGIAGHVVVPVRAAGCYAPGGRYPLPSSVLMTVTTARVAGVESVWCASPKPSAVTVAAAAVAGADALIAFGGAPAVGVLAYGCGPVPRCDMIVGPGSKWVTAAKRAVFGQVGIDMLAGPSELLVIADDSANAAWIAADLLAQAEHDVDAVPMLISTSESLLDAVELALQNQLETLPTKEIAERALANGWAAFAPSLEEGIRVANEVAPEHLELIVRDAESVAQRLTEYGGLFIGGNAAEVFGDYGAGPNHVLPTGRTARFSSGLSVLNFLRTRTWMQVSKPNDALIDDCAELARLEGLEAHARAAEMRRG